MTVGLVVGKFCPLHRGHEALFAFAAAHCDRLVIISYTKPEFAGCPPARRAEWLQALRPDATRLVLDDAALARFAEESGTSACSLPHNDAPDEAHRGFIAWVCQAMLGLTVDRVFTSEAYGDGFAASLARTFGHSVEHVAFDPDRQQHPISGTGLRARRLSLRDAVSAPVRRSLVRRVAMIGGESSGKTTLAAALAADLGTAWVPEYGRELWEERGGALNFDDLLAIAREQIAREDAALDAAERWLICDTTPLVTAYYSRAIFGHVAPELSSLAERSYDHVFLCAGDFPFVQDGTRRDAVFRDNQERWYREQLTARGVAYTRLTGSPEARRETALSLLDLDVSD